MPRALMESIDDSIILQLSQRSGFLAKKNKTVKELENLVGKTGWVKMSSAVDYYGSAGNAEENVLLGGTLEKVQGPDGFSSRQVKRSQLDSKYSYNPQGLGFRPMSGITDAFIVNQNTFGTLRQAVVEFTCWTLEDLEILEKLYMRPGFHVLLEWGHTSWRTNRGELRGNSDIRTVSNSFFSTTSFSEVQKQIDKLQDLQEGNYDGFFGIVENFQWSYRKDGGYQCKTYIISRAKVIESVRLALYTEDEITQGEDQLEKNDLTKISPFLRDIDRIIRYRSESPLENESLKDIFKEDPQNWADPTINTLQVREREGDNQVSVFKYVRFSTILQLINKTLLGYRVGVNEKYTLLYDRPGITPYFTFPQHLSADPGVCILPKVPTGLSTSITVAERNLNAQIQQKNQEIALKQFGLLQNPKQTGEELKQLETDKKQLRKDRDLVTKIPYPETLNKVFERKTVSQDDILDIWINVEFVSTIIQELTLSRTTTATVFTFLRILLDNISECLGGLNEFDIYFDDSTNFYYIVDRKNTVSEDTPKTLQITGIGSIAEEFSLTSRITPDLARIIAISAQVEDKYGIGVDSRGYLRYNKGLSDRVKPTLTLPERVDYTKEDKIEDILLSLIRPYSNLESYDNTVIGTYSRVQARVAIEANKRISPVYLSNSNEKIGAGIIPYDLTIQIEGIGGLKIGQIFKVNSGILPRDQDKNIGFIITGLDHEIKDNKWKTNIKATTFLV